MRWKIGSGLRSDGGSELRKVIPFTTKRTKMNSGPMQASGISTDRTIGGVSEEALDGSRGVAAREVEESTTVIDASPARGEGRRRGEESDAAAILAVELQKFASLAADIRRTLVPARQFKARCQQAFDVANDLFGHAPTWVSFYRELYGTKGIVVPQMFPTDGEVAAFRRSEAFRQIQKMITGLRGRDLPETDPNDPQRMITVRLPKSLHASICKEAKQLGISVNRLCVTRMLQLIDPDMVPHASSKPRGRKPGEAE